MEEKVDRGRAGGRREGKAESEAEAGDEEAGGDEIEGSGGSDEEGGAGRARADRTGAPTGWGEAVGVHPEQLVLQERIAVILGRA